MSDREASEQRFRELVERNRARLRRIARACGSDPHDAEDLLQEILPETWRSLPSYRTTRR